MCLALLWAASGINVGADEPAYPEDRLFHALADGSPGDVPPYGRGGPPLAGQPYQDFTVQPPPRTFPNCRLPLLSWRLGPGPECGEYGPSVLAELPAHAVRKAVWYGSSDLVMLRRDSRDKQEFARLGALGTTTAALSTADIDMPLDAGGQFMLGHKFTERLSLETTYLGNFEWNNGNFVRDATPNTLGGGTGTGLLSSPFTNFGLVPVQGLDFNNLVSVNTTGHLAALDILFRYRPDMPYGAYDVSFLYGLRYMAISDTLAYHSESAFPAPGGSTNDYNVATDNDMVGFQLGLTSHILILPAYWIDWDVKGTIYNNHARQNTIYTNVDNGTTATSVNNGRQDGTAYSLDVRLIGNFQLLPRLTLRAGYQATFIDGVATPVGNFQTDLNIVRLGPSFIDAHDSVIYHGPVVGLMWER
jgi:hypothetical protein